MSKIGRNAPCPCGSGKKYKKCCLLNQDGRPTSAPPIKYRAVYTDLDQLSNSVVDLINQKDLDKAEAVSRKLLTEYPDQVDGLDRLAMVYEARGDRKKAAKYYRKAADFASLLTQAPIFDQVKPPKFLRPQEVETLFSSL